MQHELVDEKVAALRQVAGGMLDGTHWRASLIAGGTLDDAIATAATTLLKQKGVRVAMESGVAEHRQVMLMMPWWNRLLWR